MSNHDPSITPLIWLVIIMGVFTTLDTLFDGIDSKQAEMTYNAVHRADNRGVLNE